MASVDIRGLEKRYGSTVRALRNIDIHIDSGSFFTLLGPSGCGKTTLLRSIAGFLTPDSGEIHIGGQRIDAVPAHRRDIGMVFQDYAIFPHLSVAANVGFGLKNRGISGQALRQRVAEALATVQLEAYAERMPSALSGGQQQRVGLARAMVIRPQLLLMDEPLSNLDAKLRLELREDIRDIQKQLGITTIYVTHDQEEALVISDRICVMNQGVVEQIGTPWEIYKIPRRRFVAGFVGAMNFFPTRRDGGAVSLLGAAVAGAAPGDAEAAVRPEDIAIVRPGIAAPPGLRLAAKVAKLSFMGREAQYTLTAADGSVILVHLPNPERSLLSESGHALEIVIPWDRIVWFDRASGDRIGA
jgi:iron(III) transport system ATP-binding protein